MLHGRKPYVLGALSLLLPLQLPQAIAVWSLREPNVATYRVWLLLARAVSGIVLGFANTNFQSTLLDLFGTSLQSSRSYIDMAWEHDTSRTDDGVGMWLTIWTCCFTASVGLGFLIGAAIISGLNPAWGFWIVVVLGAIILFLNILVPESYFADQVPTRLARGSITAQKPSTKPAQWGHEARTGFMLCWKMLCQPGFAVLSTYMGWLYGQLVFMIVVSLRHVMKGGCELIS